MRGVEVIEAPAKSVLNRVTGMPFPWSINPYRGCYHQCVFCYARRSHAYLEEDGVGRWGSRIYVKVNAPAVLRTELAKRSWKHESVAIGTVTDPYQPLEGRYRITRGVLEALRDYDTPARLITRSPLVVRDIDVLQQLAQTSGASVSISVATMDEAVSREIEPTVAPPKKRMQAAAKLAAAGIHVNVALAPILPHITDSDESIAAVVQSAREAGAHAIWHNTLYLHDVTREAFFNYLRENRPDLLARYASYYRGKYAPRELHDAIETRVSQAMRRFPKVATPAIQPAGLRQSVFTVSSISTTRARCCISCRTRATGSAGVPASATEFRVCRPPLRIRYGDGMTRDPSERLWNALKQLAQRETAVISEAEAIRRVKAIAKREGALELPAPALRFYAQEYREMVARECDDA